MKYLKKIFETQEQKWNIIPIETYMELYDIDLESVADHIKSTRDPFTKDELQEINKILKINNIENNLDQMQTELFILIKESNIEVTIVKAKDEWYYTLINKINDEYYTSYKCDQLEGLTDCLKNCL